ncbi:MAG: hypothetical protein ACFFBD_12850 [Candidatus Hodarchaeota archaeon]
MLELKTNEIIILAVQWDEVLGPTVLSMAPDDSLEDPSGVALQIYMASVTVFGQMGNTLRTEFSVPLLSLGTSHIVRVAFDSWKDETVRGKIRPFYLAIVTTNETKKEIDPFLNENIWNFVDELKKEREKYSCQDMLDSITEFRKRKLEPITEEEEEERIEEEIIVTLPPDYTVYQAIDDFNKARKLWEAENREALTLSRQAALRLGQDEQYHEGAGQALFLAAQIYMFEGNFRRAYEYFSNAGQEFNKAKIFEKSASALYNASMAAYKHNKFRDAEKNLNDALSNIADYDHLRLAKFKLQLAQVKFQLEDFEAADKTFNEALEHAKEGEDFGLAARIATAYASRLALHAEAVVEEGDRVELIKDSAEKRGFAAELFQKQNAFNEAGSSYVMAGHAYAQVGNGEQALESFKNASNVFDRIKRFREAGNAIFEAIQIAQRIKKDIEALELLNKAQEIYQKIENPAVRAQMIGNCLAKGPDLYVTRKDHFYAAKAHELAINYVDKTKDLPLELRIASYISAANFFFNQGRYDRAGDLFTQTYELFSKVPPGKEVEEQLKRCQANAFISYKRAAEVYHSTARVLLYELHTELALEMFERGLKSISNVGKIAPPGKKNESIELMKQQIANLKTIPSYFQGEERKRLTEMIEKHSLT